MKTLSFSSPEWQAEIRIAHNAQYKAEALSKVRLESEDRENVRRLGATYEAFNIVRNYAASFDISVEIEVVHSVAQFRIIQTCSLCDPDVSGLSAYSLCEALFSVNLLANRTATFIPQPILFFVVYANGNTESGYLQTWKQVRDANRAGRPGRSIGAVLDDGTIEELYDN